MGSESFPERFNVLDPYNGMMQPPQVSPEPDWEPFHLPFDIGSGRSMFVETESGPTICMRSFRRRSDGALVHGRGVFPRLRRDRMFETFSTTGQTLPDLSGYDFADK